MKYSCHVYNNFIWFWYDLDGTNPDWRCFQQNYCGVVFCVEIKVLQMQRNFLMIFWNKRGTRSFVGRPEGEGGEHKTSGHTRRPRCAQVGCAHLEAHLCVIPTLKNPINTQTIRNNPRSEVPSPQASIATKNQSRPRSSTLPEGEIIIGGHLHHPNGHHDEEGVVRPQGWGFVPVAMCLISLSLVFLRCHDLDVSRALLI